MTGKTISVPVEYYQMLAVQARQYLDWLTDKPKADRSTLEEQMLGAYIRWYQWHEQAEERGLVR